MNDCQIALTSGVVGGDHHGGNTLGRRGALRMLGGAALAAAYPPLAAQSTGWRTLPRIVTRATTPDFFSDPIVDFHTHLQKRADAEVLIALMDENFVSRIVLMPLYYGDSGNSVNDGEGSDEQALKYARRFPGRFVPFVGMQRSELNDSPPWSADTEFARRLLADTDEKLASGNFYGMGEIMLRFYPYSNRFGIRATSDMDYRADSPLMHRFAALSARYRAPMVVHAEAEPKVVDAMTRLLHANADAIVVWAHNCGRMSAAGIRSMFKRFPNLHADLGGMVYSGPNVEHYGVYFPKRTDWMHLLVDNRGNLLPDMKQLIEEYPGRYVIGTDIAHARVWSRYSNHWGRWMRFFDQIPRAAASMIAYENAERLFRGA